MDRLFLGTGAIEHYAHRQMSEWDSTLSKEGRELVTLLEKKTRQPVYYYLMKYYGKGDAAERRRRCPSCKGAWALEAPLHGILDFKCDRCRLVSNVAFDVRVAGNEAKPESSVALV